MNSMRARRLHFVLPLGLVLFLVALGTTCSSNQNQPPHENTNVIAQNSPSPSPEKAEAKSTDVATEPLTESDPALVPDEAWILSTQNIVNLTRKATNVTVAVKSNVGFKLGDLLQVGDKSLAVALCKRGTCVLGLGNYNSCCTVPCQGQVSMIRRENTSDLPIINRNELPATEAAALIDAEKGLRSLNLPPVTTQFLITTLYTNWRIKEANQELDRLSIQLASPNAKEELQGLYAPVITRTGNMHLKYKRVEDAKKLYQLNLSRTSEADDPRDRAAVHVGLAQTYELSGEKEKATSSFKTARDIYVKQGDSKAAAATEKQIEKNRPIRGVDTIRKTRPMMQKSP
jgi:hypothetical protein